MTIQEPETPSKSTLGELLSAGDETDLKPYTVLIGHNMGFNTLLLSVPIDKFYDISEVANSQTIEEKPIYEGEKVAQRELDPKHAERLATYILKGLFASVEARARQKHEELSEEFHNMQDELGHQPYLALQPLTANIRNCDFGGNGLRVERSKDGAVTVYLAPKHVLWVVDGQHRREAMRFLYEFLKDVTQTKKYPRRAIYPGAEPGDPASESELLVWNRILAAWRSGCTVMVEVHLGLTAKHEQQLFHDLNNLTKKVAPSLAFSFDNANPINVFIKEALIDAPNALFKEKIVERDNTPWSDDKGVINRKDLVAINSILFLNKNNARGAVPQTVNSNVGYASRFWGAVAEIPHFGESQAKLKTVAAQPVVLKTLAKLAYIFGLGRSKDEHLLERLLKGIPTVNFEHTNPMWRFNRLSDEERQRFCPGLVDYLPSNFVEVGSYDEQGKLFRFSPLHNDIMPAIGDMIRYSLNLPNRFEDRNGAEGGLMQESLSLPFAIEIDFPALGAQKNRQIVSESQASDTLRKSLELLTETLGVSVLEKLRSFRISRGPLVSDNPVRDFIIGTTGKLYTHQRIGATPFFVLTHSDTLQKIQNVKKMGEFLGFPSKSFRVVE